MFFSCIRLISIPLTLSAICLQIAHWTGKVRDIFGYIFTNLVKNGFPFSQSGVYYIVNFSADSLGGDCIIFCVRINSVREKYEQQIFVGIYPNHSACEAGMPEWINGCHRWDIRTVTIWRCFVPTQSAVTGCVVHAGKQRHSFWLKIFLPGIISFP